MGLPLRLKRRWSLVAIALAGVLALVVILTRPVPFKERVKQLRDGMTEAEVKAILGPPGNHSGQRYAKVHRGCGLEQGEGWIHEWMWDDGYVSIWFGDDGKAKIIDVTPHDPPPLFDGLRDRLGL